MQFKPLPSRHVGHLMLRADSLEETLMLGKTEGRRRRGRPWMSWLDSITKFKGHEFAQTLGDSEGQGSLVCCSSRCCRGGHGLGTQQQQQEAWWVTLLLASALPAQNSLVEAKNSAAEWINANLRAVDSTLCPLRGPGKTPDSAPAKVCLLDGKLGR